MKRILNEQQLKNAKEKNKICVVNKFFNYGGMDSIFEQLCVLVKFNLFKFGMSLNKSNMEVLIHF